MAQYDLAQAVNFGNFSGRFRMKFPDASFTVFTNSEMAIVGGISTSMCMWSGMEFMRYSFPLLFCTTPQMNLYKSLS